MRGYLARKLKLPRVKNDTVTLSTNTSSPAGASGLTTAKGGSFDESIDMDLLLHNKVVNKERAGAGHFNYADLGLSDEIELIDKPPFKLDANGAVYKG